MSFVRNNNFDDFRCENCNSGVSHNGTTSGCLSDLDTHLQALFDIRGIGNRSSIRNPSSIGITGSFRYNVPIVNKVRHVEVAKMSSSGNQTAFTYGISINSHGNFDVATNINVVRFACCNATVFIHSRYSKDVRMILGVNFRFKSVIINCKIVVNTVNRVRTINQ